MTQRALTLLLLYPLLAACGGDSEGESADTASALTDPCLSEITLAPVDGDITVTGHSIDTSAGTETALYSKSTLTAKDGITIDIAHTAIGGISVNTNTFVNTADECEQPEYLYVIAQGLPAHDTGSFPNSENPYAITEQTRVLRIPLNATFAATPTPLSDTRLDAVLFNAVPVQMRESYCKGASCDALGGTSNPMHAPALYGLDGHNAHVLSDGSYHYHGDPHALYLEPTDTAFELIGVAADGFPVFGPWIDDNGLIRKATSSYQMKTGAREVPYDRYFYDGTFNEDYDYIAASGDLDECNGMTANGVYGYYVTDTFPYILNCFRGIPDPSFNLVSD